MLHLDLSELSDQVDVTIESSKIVKLALTWVATTHVSTQSDAIEQRSSVYSDFFSSKRKRKPEGYHALCVQYVALSCCLSARQMAKSKQCKVPTKQGQRLDHATKLEASLADSADVISAEIEVSQRCALAQHSC